MACARGREQRIKMLWQTEMASESNSLALNHEIPIEEWDDDRIRKISADGQASTVSKGKENAGHYRDFVRLVSITRDSEGCALVADPLTHCVRRFDKNGADVIVAGSGDQEKGGFADGIAQRALFYCPTGIAVDRWDNIYIADFYNNRIRIIRTDGVVSTVAGTGVAGYKDGEGNVAQFDHPESLALDAKGNILVADWGNHRVRKISLQEANPMEQVVSPRVGSSLHRKLKSVKSSQFSKSSKRVLTQQSSAVSPTLTNSNTTARSCISASRSSSPQVWLDPGQPDAGSDSMQSETFRMRPSDKVWVVSTLAGSGEQGFKDAMGEAARFNFPHGIFVADDGETAMVIDSKMVGTRGPSDDVLASQIAAEALQEHKRTLKQQADMRECTAMFSEHDLINLGKPEGLDPQTLSKLWRWCSHETGYVDSFILRKAESMLIAGMTDHTEIAVRLEAARKIEAFRRIHFGNVLRLLRSKDKKFDQEKAAEDDKDTEHSKWGIMFDTQIMKASMNEVDHTMLYLGAKPLCQFRLQLTKRFNSIFDAWIYFDMDADGSMTSKEFQLLCSRLRLPRGLSITEVFELIDVDNKKEIVPLTFVQVLKWHKVPSSDREILEHLDFARDKRQDIFESALRRTAEENKKEDLEAAEKRRMPHRPPPKVKEPVRVPVIRLPRNSTYPHYEPVELSAVAAPEPPPLQQHVEAPKFSLPQEILDHNWNVSIMLGHKKDKGLAKIHAFDVRVDRVSNMLSEKYIKRGHVMRLKDNVDKNQACHWDRYLMVLTTHGKLMLEPENSALLIDNKWADRIVLDYDMRTVRQHARFEFNCLSGLGMELVFRITRESFLGDTKRLTRCLYIGFEETPALGLKWRNVGVTEPTQGRGLTNPGLARALIRKLKLTQDEWEIFGLYDLQRDDFIKSGDSYFQPEAPEDQDVEYEEWWQALRRFSSIADDLHAEAVWSAEEKQYLDQMQDEFQARLYLRRMKRIQRWWRRCRQEKRDHQRATEEALKSHAQLLGMAYVLRHHGPIGDQGSWKEPELDYSFSRGRFQAPRVQKQPSDASLQYRQAETGYCQIHVL
jgi:hypothetical protein